MDRRGRFVRDGCRKLLRWADGMVLLYGTKFTWLVVLRVTPPDVHTLSAALGVLDKSGTGLTIHRPSPDDRGTFPGEVFHEIRFFHQVKDAFFRYWQGLRVNEGSRVISAPATRFNGLLGSRLGRGGGHTNARNVWASA